MSDKSKSITRKILLILGPLLIIVIGDHAHINGGCWISGAAKVGGDVWFAGSQILTEGDWHGAS